MVVLAGPATGERPFATEAASRAGFESEAENEADGLTASEGSGETELSWVGMVVLD